MDARSQTIGIVGVAYRLPATVRTLDELDARGELQSRPAVLADFGFERAWVAETETALELARGAMEDLIRESGIDPEAVGVILHAGALASSSVLEPGPSPRGAALHLPDLMDLFAYPVPRLQAEFGLTRATAVGVGQQGCASLFTAIRIGSDMLMAEPDLEAAVCVAADRLPPKARRELVYNVVSDGACAVLLRRDVTANRILASGHVTKGALWDAGGMENEIIAAYFPTARTMILETLERAGLEPGDIDWIVPHNVSLRSWEILLGLLGLPRERLFAENISRVGHTIAADPLLNLRDLLDSGRVRDGDRLLLFTFGYGLNWSCLVVER